MTVENIPVPVTLEERRTKALEDQATAMLEQAKALARNAAAVEAHVAALGNIAGATGNPKADRFERMLRACVEGRVASNVEGFLNFARELCDGLDREFPAP